jgi:hypothetical protein
VAQLLPAERIEAACQAEGLRWRRKVFTPVLSVWTFLTQVLSANRSCRAAVTRVLGARIDPNRSAQPTTGGYCKARARLGEAVPRRLARERGHQLHHTAEPHWRWHGRPVKVVDGTTVSMPDTADNQREYPQPKAQKPGLGFPLMRVVAVFCLATAAVLDAAMACCQGKRTGESSLLRQLIGVLQPADVVLADRGFGSFYERALWRSHGVDAVVRLHHARRADFRTGRRLGPKDHVVVWSRPDRPEWVDQELFESLPRRLEVREVAVRVSPRGFRTRQLVVVTTLLDAEAFPAGELGALYRARWHAERDLRALKSTMGMDVLRCRAPARVRAELWMHLLGYNVVRQVLVQAAPGARCVPRELSFAAGWSVVQVLAERLPATRAWSEQLCPELLRMLGRQRVGNRPDRVEPRARKRRPKHGALLTVPRRQAQAQLRRGVRAEGSAIRGSAGFGRAVIFERVFLQNGLEFVPLRLGPFDLHGRQVLQLREEQASEVPAPGSVPRCQCQAASAGGSHIAHEPIEEFVPARGGLAVKLRPPLGGDIVVLPGAHFDVK